MTDGPPDLVGGPTTTALDGRTLVYRYSTGRRYRLRFTAETVTFDQPDDPAEPARTVPYRARELRDGLVMVHWIVKPIPAHVTLIVDLERRQLHASALMPPNRFELFDIAEIEDLD